MALSQCVPMAECYSCQPQTSRRPHSCSLTMAMKLPVLLLSLLLSRVHAETVCTLAEPFVLDEAGLVELEQVKNVADGTFTMRLTYHGGQSWIGIGINHEDSNNMSPATAVIGRMLDGEPSVLKYDLESDAKDGSGVIPMDLQNLQDVRFMQDEEKSVLEFTQLLDEATQTVTDESVWIYAVGLPDNQWEGKHKIHGAFYLRMDEDCVEVESAPTASPTTAASTGGGEQDTTAGGTNAPPVDTESEEEEEEDSEDAAGTTNTQTGIVQVASITAETRSLWVAHGVLMALAWGVCAPIAIGAVMLRHVGFLAKKGTWYKIHFYVNIANILFTFIGFFLAVAATRKEGEDHFTENTHTKAGLAIFLIVMFQFALAFLRPDPPKPPSQPSLKRTSAATSASSSYGSPGIEQGISVGPPSSSVNVNNNGEVEVADEDSSLNDSLESDPSVKSKPRLAWEISHRFIGIALLGLAWYNCTSGIQLQVEKYDENDDQMAAFWGVTAGISGLIFFFAYVVRV